MNGHWKYFGPDGQVNEDLTADQRQAGAFPDALVMGRTQLMIMLQARASANGQVIVPHARHHNAWRLAARRLVARGLLREAQVLGATAGFEHRQPTFTYVHTLTDLGRTAWLKTWIRGDGR